MHCRIQFGGWLILLAAIASMASGQVAITRQFGGGDASADIADPTLLDEDKSEDIGPVAGFDSITVAPRAVHAEFHPTPTPIPGSPPEGTASSDANSSTTMTSQVSGGVLTVHSKGSINAKAKSEGSIHHVPGLVTLNTNAASRSQLKTNFRMSVQGSYTLSGSITLHGHTDPAAEGSSASIIVDVEGAPDGQNSRTFFSSTLQDQNHSGDASISIPISSTGVLPPGDYSVRLEFDVSTQIVGATGSVASDAAGQVTPTAHATFGAGVTPHIAGSAGAQIEVKDGGPLIDEHGSFPVPRRTL